MQNIFQCCGRRIWWMLIPLLIFFAICAAFYYFKMKVDFIHILILFLLPLWQIPAVYYICHQDKKYELRGFCVIITFVCLISYLIAWLLYSLSQFSEFLSWTCTGVASGLVATAFYITWLMIHPAKKEDWANMIKQRTFPTICFFLGVFLCVTYLLSFALAFHDKWVRDKKKYPNPFALDAGPDFNQPSGSAIDQGIKSVVQADQSTEIMIILFAEGFASVDKDMEIAEDPDRLREKYQHDEDKFTRITRNNKNLRNIIDKISKYGTDQRIRITLMGHSNDKRIGMSEKSKYQSNYELSDARIRQVLLCLTEELEKLLKADQEKAIGQTQGNGTSCRNIEWLLTPVSNEEIFIGKTPPNDKRCVEVSITPISGHLTQLQMQELKTTPRDLNLLDYIYFTIYTITTTGYGDIKPVTGYAKFVVSLANLFEVFFLVIFFNALISSRGFPSSNGSSEP